MTDAEVKEFESYKAQADKGNRVAQYNLGLCYHNGDGVAKDLVQAVSWWRKAAEQGDALAQFNLGVVYEHGRGVIKNEIEAYAFYNLAGITEESARKQLASLEERLSPDARLLGQQRTIQLQKEIEGRLETAQDLLDAIRKEKMREGI